MKEDLTYEYIIAGMGCAGLSLAMQLKESGVAFNRVLLLDKDLKNKNDRTWCFWTKKKTNWFDAIVFKKWRHFSFKSDGFEKRFDLEPYAYVMVRGLDFYEYCLTELKKDARFEFITDEILALKSESEWAVLNTSTQSYKAQYVFNSAFRKLSVKKNQVNYVQHFKGWLIESPEPVFDEACTVFMDFSPEQQNDCRFVYVIPFSKTIALVEYTGFSNRAISTTAYNEALDTYLTSNLKLASYKLLESEQGEIPMTEGDFTNPYGDRVINIGTAGGNSKPSTGYTFYFIQKHTEAIIQQLKNGSKQFKMPVREKRFLIYDKILLDVLNKKTVPAKKVFTALFQKNDLQHLLAFLNEESNIKQDLKIMRSVPIGAFAASAIRKLI